MREDQPPIRTVENGTAWVFEGEDRDVKSKVEGKIVIYPGWICVRSPTAAWYPRERVEQVHEF